jgi:hypothetical protein
MEIWDFGTDVQHTNGRRCCVREEVVNVVPAVNNAGSAALVSDSETVVVLLVGEDAHQQDATLITLCMAFVN